MTPKEEARERRAAGRARRRSENGNGEQNDERAGLSHDALKILASAAARGAAQALAERRKREPEDEPESDASDDAAADPEPQTESEPEPEPEPEPDEEPEPEEEPEPMPAGELQSLVRSARAILRDLHGADAESVSSVSRSANGWIVGMEVLELERIPDSMDVLATYEVELDGDGNVLRFERGQRYTRSQAGRRGAE